MFFFTTNGVHNKSYIKIINIDVPPPIKFDTHIFVLLVDHAPYFPGTGGDIVIPFVVERFADHFASCWLGEAVVFPDVMRAKVANLPVTGEVTPDVRRLHMREVPPPTVPREDIVPDTIGVGGGNGGVRGGSGVVVDGNGGSGVVGGGSGSSSGDRVGGGSNGNVVGGSGVVGGGSGSSSGDSVGGGSSGIVGGGSGSGSGVNVVGGSSGSSVGGGGSSGDGDGAGGGGGSGSGGGNVVLVKGAILAAFCLVRGAFAPLAKSYRPP